MNSNSGKEWSPLWENGWRPNSTMGGPWESRTDEVGREIKGTSKSQLSCISGVMRDIRNRGEAIQKRTLSRIFLRCIKVSNNSPKPRKCKSRKLQCCKGHLDISVGDWVWWRKVGLSEGHMGFFHSVPRFVVLMIGKCSARFRSVPVSERNRENPGCADGGKSQCQGKLWSG